MTIMIQIVPPAKWKPRAVPISEVMNDIMVNTPIEQNVYGKGGSISYKYNAYMNQGSMSFY